jgi:hypothetical protein
MSTFSTDTLRSTIIKQNGLASNNRYRIVLPRLSGNIKADGNVINKEPADREDLGTLCTSARLPGKVLSVVDRNIGLEQIKIANGFTFSDANLSFYLTNEYSARKYFQEWMDCVVSPKPPFTAGFHSNYAKRITIEQMDRDSKVIYTVELIKAYPTSISEIDLNNQAQTAALELTVSLTYSNYIIKDNTN